MISPILQLIQQDDHISWLVDQRYKKYVESLGRVDEIISIDHQKLLKKKPFELIRALKKLCFKRYDAVFLAHPDWRYRLLLLSMVAKKKGVLKRYKGPYHGDEYLQQFAKFLDRPNPGIKKPLLTQAQKGVILTPMPINPKKRDVRVYPLKYYVKLAEKLIEKGETVYLTGISAYKEAAKAFAHLPVINMIGKQTLLEWMDFVKSVRLIITHDSGNYHLARAQGIYVIGLFGPTSPFELTDPQTYQGSKALEQVHFLWGGEDLPCRPCYNGITYLKCDHVQCMKSIRTTDIMRTYDKICAHS